MDQTFKDTLINAGYRITKPRIEVYEAIKKHDQPISLSQINELSHDSDRTSVYRALQLFHQLNIVTVVPFGWKQKYELAEPFVAHHHHLFCEVCGSVTAIDSEKIEQLVEQLAGVAGFMPTSHHFEIKGTCKECAQGTGVIA